MIYIKEDCPLKLSGITSLFVSFKFNQAVIDVIKGAEKYNYDGKTHIWELPCNYLAYLLDNLTFIDDITLTLKQDDENVEYYYPKLIEQYKIPPFDHQVEAIEYGLNHPAWLLLDEPGLGKSASIIHLAEELREQKHINHCLIICGINSLKVNWAGEITKHSNLSYRILGKRVNSKGRTYYATIDERATELMNPIDEFFIITNIETIRSVDIVNALRTTKNKIDMVVVDELHKAKSSKSQQGHSLLKLTKYPYKVGLTGTLIQSKPLDAYVGLSWIGVEKATLTNFKSQYCVFGGFGGHQIVGYKNLDILKDELASCSLRRTKESIADMPPKTIVTELVEMSDAHRKFYDSVKDGIKEECNKIELNTNNVLALTTRLMQATACPSILTTQNILSSKIERAVELVEEFVSNGNKVVIMCTFKEPLNVLYKLLQEYKPLLGTGDISEDEFEKNKVLFQEDPEYKVFLGTTQKSGTGLTLNAASYMICINTPWNASDQSQVEDRIHRIDNTEPVFIYRLVCQNTIDERVEQILDIKQALSDFIVDNKVSAKALDILKSYIEGL